MKKQFRASWLLGLVLCVCLVLGLLGAVAPVEAQAAQTQNVTINMFDSYGDGWGNNAINIFEDGNLIGTATFASGKEGTWSYEMDSEKSYEFVWVKGAWSSECYFDIVIDGVIVRSATITDCNLFANGEVVYPLCEHENCDAVVTAPTCKLDGYTTYTCTKCGEVMVGDETPATGHSFGDDNFCDICGYDVNSIHVVISMTDSFGDGWNGNGILVYENGVLLDTATLTSGMRNGTWEYDMDRNLEYEFLWKLGSFPGECSFTISYDDVVVISATRSDCGSYKNNHIIYPPCQHLNCDAVVTPDTCTTFGYTTYTCLKCGNVSVKDIVPAMGHQYGDDSVCDKCGFDKDGIIITMNDSYGDGWNGNALEVYEDGVLVGTASLSSGRTGTYAVPVVDGKVYTFNWIKGNSGYECSFEIMIDGEIVFTADGTGCTGFISGQQVYPYMEYTGWTELGGKVYYFDPVTHKPVSNANRLPYPDRPLNGITYAPNPQDVADAQAQGQTFIDQDMAWFLFDGFTCQLLQDVTAIRSTGIEGTYEYRYVVQGMIPWHVGLVYEMGYYWYFTGDAVHGGNVVSYGDVTVSRNFSDFDMVVGGVYTFDWYGHMRRYEGITQVDGVLRYYENSRLMVGKGLTKVGDNFIYVDENGELLVDTEYDVPANSLGVAAGTYSFDINGILQDPIPSGKHGIVHENGNLYYYEYGKIACNKGMMPYNGGYIYVRSNGMVATGLYYITNIPQELAGQFRVGQKMIFDENGIAQDVKNGIHEVNGQKYYFVNNQIQYCAGLIEVDGGYIYVRSNGMVATGIYYVTNTNGQMASGYYEFDAQGYMIISDVEDGIVQENDGLFLYVDGRKQLGLGLVQLAQNQYIYVRSNGQLAVGTYWVSANNGLLSSGSYEFGADGILIVE